MSDLFPITIEDMLAECRREIDMRRSVYPRLVSVGKMSGVTARRRIEVMAAVVGLLEKQAQGRRNDAPVGRGSEQAR